jgi:hypothetical protein
MQSREGVFIIRNGLGLATKAAATSEAAAALAAFLGLLLFGDARAAFATAEAPAKQYSKQKKTAKRHRSKGNSNVNTNKGLMRGKKH